MHKDILKEITQDVFDVADRIKEVDEEYRLYYNVTKSRFEVYKRGDLCVTWTEGLSAALIGKLRETHVRRRYELLQEIERSERAAEREEAHRMKETIGEKTEEFLSRGGLKL